MNTEVSGHENEERKKKGQGILGMVHCCEMPSSEKKQGGTIGEVISKDI